MKARPLVATMLAIACARSPGPVTTPAETAPLTDAGDQPTPTDGEPTTDEMPPSVATPPPPDPEPMPASPPALCTEMCVASRQMQAESIEPIADKCVSECSALATDPVPADCVAKARAASARASKGATSRRAPKVWKELGTELACGHFDPVFDALAKAGVLPKVAEREAAFAKVLVDDPFFDRLCPAGLIVLDEAGQQPAAERSAWPVRRCPLPQVDPEGATKDLPPATLLAIETLALRWEAYGARSEHHQRLLDTLRLASALEADASGGP